MPSLNVDGLTFTFPTGWEASKYDEWSFYRNQFSKQGNGIKAVDVLALEPTHTAFLVEVKDYRHPNTERPSQLAEAIADKVIHTLAAMLPAQVNANDPAEKLLASSILRCTQLRVVAHVEQPQRHQPVVDLADIKQKLKRLLRAVDGHPKVTSMGSMGNITWTVT